MPAKNILKFKRAAVMAALFFASSALAGEKAETYKDLIEKAYNLSMQQDRPQAVALLVTASKRESKKGAPPKELLAAIDEVANVFYSDKTQQLHELALSLKQGDPASALAKLTEANRLEPDNLTVMVEMLRLLLATGDCSGAQKLGEKIIDMDPYCDSARLHLAQAAICLGKFDQSLVLAAQIGSDNKEASRGPLAIYWQMADVERMFKKAEFESALDKITQIEKLNARYPEAAYWRWRVESELKQKSDKSGQRYLTGCAKLTPRQFRDLGADPNLCRRVAEVENSLKKSHNP